jgi:SAM-dependent methyltransferase
MEILLNKRFLNRLSARSYSEDYYVEHKLAGLDYLGFGEWQKNYARWLVECLAWKDRRVLDAGCACGSILRGFGEAGAVVQGVDVNEHMIQLGRQKWPDMTRLLHVCDVVNLHLFADEAWEGIHSAQVAEHWRPELVPFILQELARVVSVGGLFFCALDTEESFERQHRDGTNEDPTHICIRPMTWWHRELAMSGWQVCSAEYADALTNHELSYLRRYDWDWFIARKV